MNITTNQYRQAMKGCFLSNEKPEDGESLVLIALTCRGRRVVEVGNVDRVEPVGSVRHLVWVSKLAVVEGMNY